MKTNLPDELPVVSTQTRRAGVPDFLKEIGTPPSQVGLGPLAVPYFKHIFVMAGDMTLSPP